MRWTARGNGWAFCAISVCVLLSMGFSWEPRSIPMNEVHSGGPGKDGIPALTDPTFVSADAAGFLSSDDRVLGIELNGQAKAYPIAVLNWHELVNDVVGGTPVLVSYCPLCGSGMVFDASVSGERLLFGVSGRLYNSDVLFYDRKTDGLWSQLQMEAVTGPLTGTQLTLLAGRHTTWSAWRREHPQTLVLSTDTGYRRDYSRDPYVHYASSPDIMFPVAHRDDRLSTKTWVLGVLIDGQAKAYAWDDLAHRTQPLTDHIGGHTVQVHVDAASRSAWITTPDGHEVPTVTAYWFAWAAFHPETAVYQSGR